MLATPMSRIVSALVEALQAPDIPTQVEGVHALLSGLEVAKAASEAAAALAHTRDGSPAARAYLTTIATSFTTGPSPSADAVVAYCAAMERGRKPVRGAFLAVWKRATDLKAVDAAVKNLSRVMIDDPELLDVALEVSTRLGDRTAVTSCAARLERAKTLAPLVAQLRQVATRSNAMRRLGKLDPAARRHVYARVIDDPMAFAPALAHTAILELSEDPDVTDACLANAIAVMNPASLVKAWQKRVLAGSEAMIARMLGLFEWTALWAKQASELEPFSQALASCAGRPDVYGQVENALSSDREVVREAVCRYWLGHYNYRESQRDVLMRMALAIAEGRDDTLDRQAATEVIATTRFAAAFGAISDGIRTTRSKTLRALLYRSLATNLSDHTDAFLVERLFVERESLADLVEAIAARRNTDLHRQALAELTKRAPAFRAATLYADALQLMKNKPGLVEVAELVTAWTPANSDDERRMRYVLEHATTAALSAKKRDVAGTLWTRAKQLPPSGYSDYHVVGHDRVTPMPTEKLVKLDATSRAKP